MEFMLLATAALALFRRRSALGAAPAGCFLLHVLLAGRPLLEVTVLFSCAALVFDEFDSGWGSPLLSVKRRLF